MRSSLLFVLFFLCFSFFGYSQIHYVKMDGVGDGSSWEEAHSSLQTAIDNALLGDTIWVAEGTYRPVECTLCTEAERDSSFFIQNEIVLLGGFPEVGNPGLEERDRDLYLTLLSGDIGMPNDDTDNSRRIIVSESPLTMDGFTIIAANSDVPGDAGAGIRVVSLYASNCTFENNYSVNNGGAIAIVGGTEELVTKIENCQFINNTAENGGAIFVADSADSDFEVFDSRFDNNEAVAEGGAVKIGSFENQGYFNRCHFTNNSAADGGCIHFGEGNNTLGTFNSLFYNNQATQNGGALNVRGHGNTHYCTFVNNSAASEGNICYIDSGGPNLAIINFSANIFYNNLASNFTFYVANTNNSISLNRNYIDEPSEEVLCNLNISSYSSYFGKPNPFVDPNGDFHLFEGSPAIDVGSYAAIVPTIYNSDIEGTRRNLGFKADAGAYEYAHSDCPDGIVYVNESATGDNNGMTWEHAFTSLGEALNKINYCPVIEEIWIAEGMYLPTECLGCNQANTDSTDFRFLNPGPNVPMFGGFPNTGNPTMTDRDWVNYPTILSGNIGDPNDSDDNTEKVIVMSNLELDGLIISDSKECAVKSDFGDPRMFNCWIRNNQGEGVRVREGRLEMYDCRFSHNEGIIASAYSSGYDADLESIRAYRCIFEYNGGETGSLRANSVYAKSSLFIGNTTEENGGAISADTYATATNCTFVNNSADEKGSAIYSGYNTGFWNCIFWGNHSSGSAKTIEREDPITLNSAPHENILTDETDCDSFGENIDCDSGFIFDAEDPFVSIADENFQLKINSIAINAGNNNAGTSGAALIGGYDLNKLPRINDGLVDIGAYEYNDGCSFYFTRQSEIDDFQINNPGLDTVQCDVYIRSGNEDPITNLNGLLQLTSIQGFLWIEECDHITTLDGLDNIAEIGNYFLLDENPSLTNIDALNGLTSIGGYCDIINNENLESISSLDNLSEIGEYFQIRHNENLSNIDGVNSLVSIGGYLNIYENINLTSINGFASLPAINDYLHIERNDQLATLEGFNTLTSIGSFLRIINNNSLTSLSGMLSLNSIGTFLTIENNSSLTSLSGLDNIDPTGMTNLVIRFNDQLSVCHVPFVCSYLLMDGPTYITNNASGCHYDLEILSRCDDVGKILYPLFYDVNENGILESGEPFLSFSSVLIEPEGYVSYGNTTNGGFKYLANGDYSISYNETGTPDWETTISQSTYNFTLDESNPCDTVYFGLKPIAYISNITSQITNNLPRCNEFVTFTPHATNNGTTIANGTLWFTADEHVLDVDFVDMPDTIVAPNRYGWFFTDLYPQAVLQKQIRLQFPGPPDFPLGDSLSFQSDVDYSDINGSNSSNTMTHTLEVQCSYDPNDKLVSPSYPENYALTDEALIYTIRFQNTGNAEAYKVVIIDELDPNLDLSTFQYIASSHESVLSTFLEGNTATFEFRDIFLPDSTTNFDESQGYVMYSIRANSDVSDFTNIQNTADIFFDFNPAVVTNTTENTIVSTFDADEDGVELWIDCDDYNALVNFNMEEVPYNGLDDDCNSLTLDDDLDQDGFLNADDCDDNNALVNQNASEIPYNGLDDDCDPTTLDDDFDQDGFVNAEDCDDNDPLVNISDEIPYNGLDDDCDEATLDDDLDQDGFGIAEDCDDNNALVNVGEEIPYNGLDDDCDETTLNDDLDQDGFGIAEDCDDENPFINPDAEEIPNNGIDEDCDGEDLMVSTQNVLTIEPQLFPNPTLNSLQVVFPTAIEGIYEVRSLSGELLMQNELSVKTAINLEAQAQGVYVLFLKTNKGVWTDLIIKM